MTAQEIAKAKIGDRVKFAPLQSDAGEYSEGTITHKLGGRIEITWDDGDVHSMGADPASRVMLK